MLPGAAAAAYRYEYCQPERTGLHPQVQTGDQVTIGQTLIKFDLNAIASAGYPVITPVIVANAADQPWESHPEYGSVKAGMGTIMKVSLSK